MKQTKIIMGMPITVEIVGTADESDIQTVFDYFEAVDQRFSPYKGNSELSKVNRGLPREEWSKDMREVMRLCDETTALTNGYFNILHNGQTDPSGLVKGWAIQRGARLLAKRGFKNFFIEAGGDIQVGGRPDNQGTWHIGIRNPFNIREIIKVIALSDKGVATSGNYIRGNHIYNPHDDDQPVNTLKSLTVIGPNVYEADRFATAAFAMGLNGINFIEQLPGYEAYMVDANRRATLTTGFEAYVVQAA